MNYILLTILLLIVTAIAVGFALRSTARRTVTAARARARELIDNADRQAQIRLKEIELELAERASAGETEFETRTRKKRQEMQQLETRLRDQERNLQRRLQLLGQKQKEVDTLDAELRQRESAIGECENELKSVLQEGRARLEKVSGLTVVQARREMAHEIESEARQEASQLVRRIEEEARENAAERGRRIVAEAVQRLPTREWVDNVVTVVRLPNEDMKGRIIGREGRNIRAIEMATGVDLIVDETPQAIILSSFDPFRRAVSQVALERLIEDGRIHPARIEEVVDRARAEIDEGLEPLGEAAAFDLGITGLPSRLARLIGKLKYRIVSGYNLLDHSVAVARLAHEMATLMTAKTEIATRAGLLHEVGQAEEGDHSSTHPILLSADLAAKFGESAGVVNAIRSLHEGIPDASVEAVLLNCAERTIIARPGERDDNLMVHIERMKGLESIASSFSGVGKAFAMRSGKEVRVIVEAGSATDSDAIWLSKDICSRIRNEIRFPGAIRVHVIRETRAIDYAT